MKELRIGGMLIPVPIVQGGMGVGVSLSGLAAAVANEGGIGVISSAGLGLLYAKLSSDFLEASILGLKEEMRKVKEKTKGIIGVNIMVAMSNFEDMVKTAIAEKVDIIFSGAGLPLNLPKFQTPDSVTKLAPIVSSGKAARLICEKWKSAYNYLPDAIVVEGPKAGGHLGFKKDQIDDPDYALEKLIPQVVSEVRVFEEKYDCKIPVIAAGGVYTGSDMYEMMQCGASAVQLGTRFVTTNECDASLGFKQTYLDASENEIEIIQSPVGMPGRAITNSFLDKVRAGLKQPIKCRVNCIKTCDIHTAPYCIIQALMSAYRGKMNNGYAFAGSNAFRATKINSVKEVMSEIMADFKAKIKEKTSKK